LGDLVNLANQMSQGLLAIRRSG